MSSRRHKPTAELGRLIAGLSDLAIRVILSEEHRGCHCRYDLVRAEAERRRVRLGRNSSCLQASSDIYCGEEATGL